MKAIDSAVMGTGVKYTFTPTSNHIKVRLAYEGQERLVVMSTSASDHRAMKNQIRDIRNTVRKLMGAQ